MAVAPRKLGLTRDQFASFLQDFEQIKQFENLFAAVDTIANVELNDINIAAGNANAAANEANDSIQRLLDALDRQPSDQSSELLAAINQLRQELETIPRNELGTMAALQQANVPWFTFNTAPTPTPTDIGSLYWNGGTTLNMQMTANVVQRIGENLYYYIKASAAITKGQVSMFDGAVGASGVLKGKPATGVTNGAFIMGIAAETIANNGFGLVQINGPLQGINTSTFLDGDVLWYDTAVTGGLTKTEPLAPNVKVQVAAVARAANNGTIVVRITAGSILGGTDSNVQFGTLSNGDLIQYDGTLQYWKNVSAASVIAGTASTPVTKTANFTVGIGETWIINNKSGSTCTVTLPSAATNSGRVITFQNNQDQSLISASSNVVPQGGGSAGTAILENVSGNWATLVSNGTNWVIMQAASFNNLLF